MFNPDCRKDLDLTQNCHTLSKKIILTYESNPNSLIKIKKDIFEVLFPKKQGRRFFYPFRIKKDPTFRGFCNSCDDFLFKEADNYIHILGDDVPDAVLLQLHYRQICYGIIDLERIQLLNKELLAFAEDYYPESKWINTLKKEIIPNFSLVYSQHLEIKENCEYYLNKINQTGKFPPNMQRIFLKGDKTNPLCFGRVGYYAYQYAYSEEEVISKFFYFLPFATFSSIVGVQGESHLVFTLSQKMLLIWFQL
ncbi:hypothetical protein [Legionella clemsonensis]|uniref:Uncharacterized protein n=1 Tax=Legionella clemsonensis TaxID=1867846 RepID=A0A222NYS8_9GAMM|nr:hypothetical protein [Legionella clemsonensis]ASQ44739.1 hypothetical protein clem_00865 [Legionella clemsonensis]